MKIKSITQNGHTEDLLKREDAELLKTGQALNKQTLHHFLVNEGDSAEVAYPKYLKRNAKTPKGGIG